MIENEREVSDSRTCHKVFPCRALLLSAPAHEATQPPHRSRKPTEEEALTGQAPALIHQTRCKNQLSEPQPAPDPRNVRRFRVVAAENVRHSSNATPFFFLLWPTGLDDKHVRAVAKEGKFHVGGKEKNNIRRREKKLLVD